MISASNYTPLRFRDIGDELLITNEVGDFGLFPLDTVERFFAGTLPEKSVDELKTLGVLIDNADSWQLMSLARRLKKQNAVAKKVHYLILIPTLRCNLTCSYCQVSRAPLAASGFDWNDKRLDEFSAYLDTIEPDHLKVEFQGGEPTLRPDLISKIMEICLTKAKSADFVICTNILDLSPEVLKLFDREDTVISTSLDGPLQAMSSNRTKDDNLSIRTQKNLEYLLKSYGPGKVSALPTITEDNFSNFRELIDTYIELGFQSIFLRPVNYQGFARKKHAKMHEEVARWNNYYTSAIEYIKERNRSGYFEEFYLASLARKIFGHEESGFVDLRSPVSFLSDYAVIDFNGKIYPSDEARMLSRIKHVDLAVGDLTDGVDSAKILSLNSAGVNQVHEDCLHCVYMPFCGIDIVDDISRYGRIDLPKADTWFCNRHMFMFDFLFQKVQSKQRDWLDLFLRWARRSTEPSNAYALFS
ncbi:MAG: His-Xaa-Ser system radical SAM maturase HxsB [Woeseia sp.]